MQHTSSTGPVFGSTPSSMLSARRNIRYFFCFINQTRTMWARRLSNTWEIPWKSAALRRKKTKCTCHPWRYSSAMRTGSLLNSFRSILDPRALKTSICEKSEQLPTSLCRVWNPQRIQTPFSPSPQDTTLHQICRIVFARLEHDLFIVQIGI